MGANLKTVLIIDIECTCWETLEEQGDKPNEIIEIGVAALNTRSGDVFQRASIAVKPRFTEVSPFCTKLTGWTQAAADQGLDILDALAKFQEDFKVTKNHLWFSCGEYDRVKLSSLSGKPGLRGLYGIPVESNPFDKMRAHINIKTLFALKHQLDRELGMKAMLERAGEKLEGRHHSGVADACNIAKLVWHVLRPGEKLNVNEERAFVLTHLSKG